MPPPPRGDPPPRAAGGHPAGPPQPRPLARRHLRATEVPGQPRGEQVARSHLIDCLLVVSVAWNGVLHGVLQVLRDTDLGGRAEDHPPRLHLLQVSLDTGHRVSLGPNYLRRRKNP